MRLSDAMVLGSTTCEMKAGDINSCAIGSALNALGVRKHAMGDTIHDAYNRYYAARKLWPWLDDTVAGIGQPSNAAYRITYGKVIVQVFDDWVVNGVQTFDQLVEMVRQCEPDCGACGRVACMCGLERASETKEPAVEIVSA